LRKWRGKLLQKEAAQLLGVSVRTYEAWEAGAHEPTSKPSMRDIEQRMKETSK
jgi:DNA-binding transcriptional regulator YiaG